MMFETSLVLDTCALLWLASGDERLSAAAREQIENSSIVFVSSISAWEISLKAARKQLVLPMEAEKWFNLAAENHSLTVYPPDVSIMCLANRLPFHHRDPADRFIIATAMKENAAVVTTDEVFLKYDVRVIS